jgi:hypothetical protein
VDKLTIRKVGPRRAREKALGDAERRRMVEVGRGARKEYRISELLSSAKFRAWAGSRPPFIEPRIPRGRGW